MSDDLGRHSPLITPNSPSGDAEYTGRETDVVWGGIFEIDAAQKPRRDHVKEMNGHKLRKDPPILSCSKIM